MGAIPDLSDDTKPVELIIKSRQITTSESFNNTENGTKFKGIGTEFPTINLPDVIIQTGPQVGPVQEGGDF